MLLLRTAGSADTEKDSFDKSLNPLLSRHRIVKSLIDLQWREEIYDKTVVVSKLAEHLNFCTMMLSLI